MPQDRKLAAQQAKEKAREARARANAGMAAGDERYLPVRDKGPQKRYARDVVDARWSVGELLLPVMGVVVVLTFVLPNLSAIPLLSIYVFVIAAIIDAYSPGAASGPPSPPASAPTASSAGSAGTRGCVPSRCGRCACPSPRSSGARRSPSADRPRAPSARARHRVRRIRTRPALTDLAQSGPR